MAGEAVRVESRRRGAVGYPEKTQHDCVLLPVGGNLLAGSDEAPVCFCVASENHRKLVGRAQVETKRPNEVNFRLTEKTGIKAVLVVSVRQLWQRRAYESHCQVELPQRKRYKPIGHERSHATGIKPILLDEQSGRAAAKHAESAVVE
jgi:hypothetical protein